MNGFSCHSADPILALDLSSHVGWAAFDGEGVITSGVAEFPRHEGGQGGRFAHFEKWLQGLALFEDEYEFPGSYDPKVHRIVYEAPLPLKAPQQTELNAYLVIGFISRIQQLGWMYDIAVEAVPIYRIKQFATGKGNSKKAAVIEAVNKKYGTSISDDNEADARALLWYAMEGRS